MTQGHFAYMDMWGMQQLVRCAGAPDVDLNSKSPVGGEVATTFGLPSRTVGVGNSLLYVTWIRGGYVNV